MNPINHFKISELISSEWKEIRDFLKKSKISEFKPIFDMSGERTFFQIDFDLIERRTVELLSKYRSCLKTDISRYYHTIYTHSIPWALHTKAYCKANYTQSAFKATLGDRLDKAIRDCQGRQTIGIPVGPDTSRVIGEIIGVAIEQEIAKQLLSADERSIRYVDDIHIAFDERDSVDGLLGIITKAFSHFELDINIEKTSLLGVGEVVRPEWIAALSNFRVSAQADRQQADVEHYFKTALFLSEENNRDQVLVYAIKRSRSFRIVEAVFAYYVTFLLRLCRKDSSCLPAVVQILVESNHLGKVLDRSLIQKFIVDIIRFNAPIHNYFEVSWVLFLAKALRVVLKNSDLKDVFGAESSVCALLLMDLNSRKLIDGGIDTSYWQTIYGKDGLRSNMWLFVYEATLKKWIAPASPCFVDSHPLFGVMLRRKVSFYDVEKNVHTTKRELTLQRLQQLLTRRIFQNVERYF
ncbi:RNA-directed DNA polymerase [Bradyrhizobium sp.]|uniref:RNA-directed DNA polymerase n=1 Tax=Bradyrhizobium sp. TaxID=376 RepID=UPI0025B7A865|nr:RNA-directed DNA polymerase [Bradyrhizobium sp.]MBV8894791.1 RNA-directed DNA polymerase [Acidobacteriota bacterium]MBV8918706.1 RNA-directed DNA polymerase [Bradyrhizobium sp.]